jgi:hypothetical protein
MEAQTPSGEGQLQILQPAQTATNHELSGQSPADRGRHGRGSQRRTLQNKPSTHGKKLNFNYKFLILDLGLDYKFQNKPSTHGKKPKAT